MVYLIKKRNVNLYCSFSYLAAMWYLKEKDTNLDEQRKLQIKVSLFKHSILCLNPFLPTCS